MRKRIASALVGAVLLTSTSISMATEDTTVLITAGTESLTQAQFNLMQDSMPPQLRMMLETQPELRKGMLNKWAEFSILAQEAAAIGLGKEKAVQLKIKEITNRILVEEYISRHTGKTTVTDEMVQNYYNENKAEFPQEEEVKAQHILIMVTEQATEEEQLKAKEKIFSIQRQLKEGADFATLAQKHSDDTGSGANGGELGFFGRGRMVPVFEEAAFSTTKGQVSEPVQSKFGWHLIKINDRKEAGAVPLAEVRPKIESILKQQNQQQEVEEILTQLKKNYAIKIEVDK